MPRQLRDVFLPQHPHLAWAVSCAVPPLLRDAGRNSTLASLQQDPQISLTKNGEMRLETKQPPTASAYFCEASIRKGLVSPKGLRNRQSRPSLSWDLKIVTELSVGVFYFEGTSCSQPSPVYCRVANLLSIREAGKVAQSPCHRERARDEGVLYCSLL